MNLKILLRFAIVLAIIAVILFLFFRFTLIVMSFLVAYIFHFALKPFVNILEQKGLNHSSAVTAVFIVCFGIFAIFLRLFIPAVATEILSIQDNFSVYRDSLNENISWIEKSFLGKVAEQLSSGDYNLQEKIGTYISNTLLDFARKAPGMLFSILPLFLYIFIIPFATFFFLLHEVRMKKKLINLVPNQYFEITLNLIYNLNLQFGLLLRGMLLTALIISVIASIGLWIIDIEYHILVGLFSGISNLIPFVGPIVGTIAACCVSLMTGMPSIYFLYIILIFLIVNLIDNVLVQPIVFARAANLHPLMVILLVLLGSQIAGIIGMLVAVPLVSLLSVVFRIFYESLNRPVKPPFSEYRDTEFIPPKTVYIPDDLVF
ncbi:MAG: AI-2E family transporter [Candidatus Latescibacteria bacterium]|jgi:predicted PurR-regulated permease PerM|nr:AI-2E family transporter [Candidatus Latescibacterota bacterium]